MEDQNKDGKKPISSGVQPGPGEHFQDASQQTTSASDKTFITANLKESGARITAEAKQYAGDMANRVKESGRTMFEEKKESAVGQVENVAHAIRNTATHLQGEGQAQVARYIGVVADQLESFSGRLREKNLDTIISDTQNLARRSPGTFFVGTVVTGFLLARFLKSTTERRETGAERSDANWRSPPATGTASLAAKPAGSGSIGASGIGASGTPVGETQATSVGTSTGTSLNGPRAGGSPL